MGENNKDKTILVTRASMPEYEEFIEAIKPLWDSHWLTNMGVYHNRLEQELKEFMGANYVSLMVNGHMALEMTLQAFDFLRGSEVITTPFTFISTTHAIVRNGLEPVFCDVKDDGTIDASKIEDLVTEKTVAILPVHVYGNICDVDEIQKIADKFGLKVIYDAAHAFSEEYDGKSVGCFGDASIFSFHATKVFNTIEGGAVVTPYKFIYDKLYNLKNFGIHGEELVSDIGANAKMNEMSAIMGLCNLKHLNDCIDRRAKIVSFYDGEISKTNGSIRSLLSKKASRLNCAYYPIYVCDDYKYSRDELYNHMIEMGVHPRKYFYPLTADQACFKNKYKNVGIPIARDMAKRVLSLPIYDTMDETEMKRVIDTIVG